jgi:hypothetical protein
VIGQPLVELQHRPDGVGVIRRQTDRLTALSLDLAAVKSSRPLTPTLTAEQAFVRPRVCDAVTGVASAGEPPVAPTIESPPDT